MSRRTRSILRSTACVVTTLGLSCGSDAERINPTLADGAFDDIGVSDGVGAPGKIFYPPPPPPPWFEEVAIDGGVNHQRPLLEYRTLQGRMSGGVCGAPFAASETVVAAPGVESWVHAATIRSSPRS